MRPPHARGQVVPRRKTCRFLTWLQLWLNFRRAHPEMAAKMSDVENPTKAPTLFRDVAPWNLVKGKETL
jgi:hypothetical protein